MTSLNGALESALSGMRLAQQNISIISGNISNASNEDYTRKSLNTEAIISTSGQGGVRVIGYNRAVDAAISNAYTGSLSEYGKTSAQSEYFTGLKDLFGISTDSAQLSTTLSNFANAWQVLSSAPESIVNRSNVMSAGQALASEIKRVSSGIEAIDRQIRSDTGDAVAQVNGILGQVKDLNGRISSGVIAGQNVTDLQDQLDTKVRELSGYINIKILPGNQGTVRLVTPQGFSLLDADATQLSYNGTSIMANGQDVSTYLTGGKLEALVNMRLDRSPATASTDPGTEVIRKLRDQLEQVAQNFLSPAGSPTSFAAAYNNATTSTGELAAGFFTGSDRFNITVNAALLNGSATVKTAAVDTVTTTLTDSSRNYNVTGLSVQNTSYLGYVNSMLSNLGNSSATITSQSQLAGLTRDNYKERFSANSGVNVDNELATLTQVQNSYAVSAHIVSVIGEVYDILNQMVARG